MKCYYCENEATVKDYRDNNGCVGKVLVCADCFNTNDVGVREIEHQMTKAVDEIFNYDQLDNIIDSVMGEFWDTVNNEVYELQEEMEQEFEDETGIPPHEDTIEKWRDKYFSLIQSKVKKQL